MVSIDKKIIPKVANDVKLISAGKILENNKTIAQCKPTFGELPSGVITMHVVVQPSVTKTKSGNLRKCLCKYRFFNFLLISLSTNLLKEL